LSDAEHFTQKNWPKEISNITKEKCVWYTYNLSQLILGGVGDQ